MDKWKYRINLSQSELRSIFEDGYEDKYYGMTSTDLSGYLRDGLFSIYYAGLPYIFKFDKDGNMVTGISETNGSWYYFLEDGPLKGAMMFFPVTMGNKRLIFDVYGRIVRQMDITTGEVEVLQSTYQKMLGMDFYYQPIPSLVGWKSSE